jgi:hypothetical protein
MSRSFARRCCATTRLCSNLQSLRLRSPRCLRRRPLAPLSTPARRYRITLLHRCDVGTEMFNHHGRSDPRFIALMVLHRQRSIVICSFSSASRVSSLITASRALLSATRRSAEWMIRHRDEIVAVPRMARGSSQIRWGSENSPAQQCVHRATSITSGSAEIRTAAPAASPSSATLRADHLVQPAAGAECIKRSP